MTQHFHSELQREILNKILVTMPEDMHKKVHGVMLQNGKNPKAPSKVEWIYKLW